MHMTLTSPSYSFSLTRRVSTHTASHVVQTILQYEAPLHLAAFLAAQQAPVPPADSIAAESDAEHDGDSGTDSAGAPQAQVIAALDTMVPLSKLISSLPESAIKSMCEAQLGIAPTTSAKLSSSGLLQSPISASASSSTTSRATTRRQSSTTVASVPSALAKSAEETPSRPRVSHGEYLTVLSVTRPKLQQAMSDLMTRHGVVALLYPSMSTSRADGALPLASDDAASSAAPAARPAFPSPSARNAALATALGWAAVTVPCGLVTPGVAAPVGVELLAAGGGSGGIAQLLQWAAALQRLNVPLPDPLALSRWSEGVSIGGVRARVASTAAAAAGVR